MSTLARGPIRRSREHVWRESASALREELATRTLKDAADFVMQRMPDALFCTDKLTHLAFAFGKAPSTGLALEFGVYKGTTINYLANKWRQRQFYGFDSFRGLPDAWAGFRHSEANFDRGGKKPRVRSNVTLVEGWFNETLPEFLETHKEPIAFLHVDCDIYSSTKTVLDLTVSRLAPGAVIVFDEFFNYKGYERHEYKAFFEWVEQHRIDHTFIGYSGQQVSVIVNVAAAQSHTRPRLHAYQTK
jgi:predicted O-methyltransferase YrrM